MSTQTVYRLQDFKSYHSLKEFQEPIPSIDKHEVLIKIHGVSLNFRDIAISTGLYPLPTKDNVVPCSDGAGEVVEVGSAVDDLEVGAKVVGNFSLDHLYGDIKTMKNTLGGGIDGVLRQYIALPRSAVVVIPSHAKLDYLQMASLVCTGVTAWNAFYGNKQLTPGKSVLFQGTGGVSITGLQIAKAAGATTFITSSSDDKLEFVKKTYGVDHIINYKKTPDWAAEVNKITAGRGVDYILENGGSGTIKQSIAAIAITGTIALIGFLSQAKQEDMPDITMLAMQKNCIIRGILVGPKQYFEDLVQFVVAKDIAPPVDKVFGFSRDQVIAAYDYLKSGKHIGKVCISLD